MSDWIAGINAVSAALEAGQDLAEVLIDGKAKNPRLAEIGSAAKAAGIALRFVPLDQIERQAAGARHQGVIARVQSSRIYDERDLEGLIEAAAKPLLLILDGVQDPHNLGACLRSAAAAGATAVIVPKDRAATLTPTARKVAAGGAERVPLVRVTNLARCMKDLQDAGIWIVGLAGEASRRFPWPQAWKASMCRSRPASACSRPCVSAVDRSPAGAFQRGLCDSRTGDAPRCRILAASTCRKRRRGRGPGDASMHLGVPRRASQLSQRAASGPR